MEVIVSQAGHENYIVQSTTGSMCGRVHDRSLYHLQLEQRSACWQPVEVTPWAGHQGRLPGSPCTSRC